MLTIEKAMSLPALNETKLIAGEAGTGHAIKWVTTIEIIEDISRFQDGEFVVTTGFGLTEQSIYRERLVELIRLKKLSGLAIYNGFYLDHIPLEIINAANEVDLPVIEIPTTINFSTITKAIVEQIGNEQMRILEESLTIHKEMTKLALKNNDINEVLRKLCPLTGASFFIFDVHGEIHSFENIHPEYLTVENEKLFLGKEDVNILALFSTDEVHSSQHSRFIRWENSYIVIINMELGSLPFGYLFAFLDKAPLTDMEIVLIEHVSTLIGIELVKQHAVEEMKLKLQGELIEELFQKKNINSEDAIKRGKRLGFDLNKAYAVMYFCPPDSKKNFEDNTWGNNIHYIASQILTKHNRQHIFLQKGNSLYIVIEVDIYNLTYSQRKEDLLYLARLIYERSAKHHKLSLVVGIGSAFEGPSELSKSAKESEYAVQYSSLHLKETNIIHYDDLGIYQLMIQMKEAGIPLKQFYVKYLGKLIEGKQHRTDLILTLDTFLTNNCNIQQTANSLYIHRHTLKYRLSQIEQRTGLNIQSSSERMNLHIAILAYKFEKLHAPLH